MGRFALTLVAAVFILPPRNYFSPSISSILPVQEFSCIGIAGRGSCARPKDWSCLFLLVGDCLTERVGMKPQYWLIVTIVMFAGCGPLFVRSQSPEKLDSLLDEVDLVGDFIAKPGETRFAAR